MTTKRHRRIAAPAERARPMRQADAGVCAGRVRKQLFFGRNILKHAISMDLPFVPPPSILTCGSNMRGMVGPMWVRNIFSIVFDLYIIDIFAICFKVWIAWSYLLISKILGRLSKVIYVEHNKASLFDNHILCSVSQVQCKCNQILYSWKQPMAAMISNHSVPSLSNYVAWFSSNHIWVNICYSSMAVDFDRTLFTGLF